MPRHTEIYTGTHGRDAGKKFLLTEADAFRAEWFAARALRAASVAGVPIPDNWEDAGMEALFLIGFESMARLPAHELKELMDEMMSCVEYIPTNTKLKPRALLYGTSGDIEEIQTVIAIRRALFYLHTGFSKPAPTSDTE